MANNIERLLASVIASVQDAEDMLQQLKSERTVDTAVGAQLDVIGRLVGQPRNGLGDDDYRRYVRARVSANRSNGTMADLIKVANLIIYNDAAYIKLDNQGIATIVVRVQNVAVTAALADILIAFLRDTVSAAVRVILEYSAATPGTTFKWDTAGRGWDSGAPFLDAKD